MSNRNYVRNIGVSLALGLFVCILFGLIISRSTKAPEPDPVASKRNKVSEPNLWEHRVWDVNNDDEEYWKEWTDHRNALMDHLVKVREGKVNNWEDTISYLPTTAEDFLDAFYDPKRKDNIYIERLDMHEFQKVNARFRQEYPIVSLVSRLKYEDTSSKLEKHSKRHHYDLASTTAQLHDEWNEYYYEGDGGRPPMHYVRPLEHRDTLNRGLRHQALEKLHTEGVRAFANVMAEFGLARIPKMTQFDLYAQDSTCVDLPQDTSKLDEGWYSLDSSERNLGDGMTYVINNLRENYPKYMHLAFYHQFAEDRNFVTSFRNAAGFEPHAVSDSLNWRYEMYKPPKEPRWQVARMELVGLLKHDEPVVYVSTMLPNMKQLVDGETRPLDEFESVALKKIYDGEFIVTEPRQEKLRMLGAVRAGETCIDCHAVKAGEMLGAFSYVLTPHSKDKQDAIASNPR